MAKTYEQRLDADLNWAFAEGSLHFEKQSQVHLTMRRFAANLESRAIPYAIAGPMCLFAHGYRRFTEVVEMVVGKDRITCLQPLLNGFETAEFGPTECSYRDLNSGVLVRLHIGDEAAIDSYVEFDGLRYLSLPEVVQDLLATRKRTAAADVQDAIKRLALPRELAASFPSELCASYVQLWESVRAHPPLYLLTMRVDSPLPEDATWDDCILATSQHADEIRRLRDVGTEFATCPGDPFAACFLTRDLDVARENRFQFDSDM